MSLLALVVEPDIARAAAYQNLIEAHGLSVTRARDGAEAIEAAKSKRPVLILTELALAKRDGFEVR